MISILDYDMGNLRSVQKAIEKMGGAAQIIREPEQIAAADHLILPGVGAFRDAMQALKDRKLVAPILKYVETGKPFLGICLGLQLLFDRSFEDGEYEGLGIFRGDVVRFQDQPGLVIPHMGWNQLNERRDIPLFENIPASAHFYFVHSYHAAATEESIVAARTQHGENVVAVVRRDNVFATQFHPEKSQSHGLQLLKNFMELTA